MDQETKEKRLKCITGTDIAAICGTHPYKSGGDVWLEKKKLVEVNIDNEFTRWGIKLEEVIATRYAEDTGHILTESDFISDGLFGGSPDRLCIDDENIGLEIKNASWRQSIHYGEPGSDSVPTHYLLQCVWYMMLAKRERWDLAVLIGGNDFRIYTILRKPLLEEKLKRIAESWWENHIINNQQPDLSNSQFAAEYLKNKYPSNNGEIIVASEDIHACAYSLAQVNHKLKEFELKKEVLETKMKQCIGKNDGVGTDAFEFTWKKIKDSKKLDADAILKELSPPADLIKKHTKIIPGYRKIYFKHSFNLEGVEGNARQ